MFGTFFLVLKQTALFGLVLRIVEPRRKGPTNLKMPFEPWVAQNPNGRGDRIFLSLLLCVLDISPFGLF